MKVLVVIDMQNDFVDGALGTREAEKIVSRVAQKIRHAKEHGVQVVFTQDTHTPDYLRTQEGTLLPVVHCVKGTDGFELCEPIAALVGDSVVFEKSTFASVALAKYLCKLRPDEVELVGLCTDICVISNALMIKSFLSETKVTVDASCCAGVTPQSHENALNAMKMCQVSIL